MIVLGFDTVTKLALKLIGSFQNAHPSNNMDKMLVKSYLGAGFGRVLLWVLTLDHQHYAGQLAAGSDHDMLRQYFFPINPCL